MFRPVPIISVILLIAATDTRADAPRVLVDTAPLHSLVAQVMAGVGVPDLLLPAGVSPHDFQFRPSDAARLTAADLVIWTGHTLVPWLEEPLATLAPETPMLELLDSPGWTALPRRSDAAFAAPEAPDESEAGHDHDHGNGDPHAWLSPDVAQVWIGTIAETLAVADPDNAAAYRANAVAAAARIDMIKAEIAAMLTPVQGRAFIVPHDAYQYFEQAFDMPAAGAISLSDASAPGPARLATLRDMVVAGNVACILTDPETSPAWAGVLSDGTLARTAVADPDGMTLTAGPELYDAVLRGIAAALADCLS